MKQNDKSCGIGIASKMCFWIDVISSAHDSFLSMYLIMLFGKELNKNKSDDDNGKSRLF